jgi:ribosomal protein L25 (general stress protein Ctc)
VARLKTLQFQGPDAGQHRFTERERDRDMHAYRDLRHAGYQPKNVFGSAEIAAQASTTYELEHSVVMKPAIRKEMESKMAQTQELFNA